MSLAPYSPSDEAFFDSVAIYATHSQTGLNPRWILPNWAVNYWDVTVSARSPRRPASTPAALAKGVARASTGNRSETAFPGRLIGAPKAQRGHARVGKGGYKACQNLWREQA